MKQLFQCRSILQPMQKRANKKLSIHKDGGKMMGKYFRAQLCSKAFWKKGNTRKTIATEEGQDEFSRNGSVSDQEH